MNKLKAPELPLMAGGLFMSAIQECQRRQEQGKPLLTHYKLVLLSQVYMSAVYRGKKTHPSQTSAKKIERQYSLPH